MRKDTMWRRAWVEVDLDALADNYRVIRGALAPRTKLCCVIKANAYGHGALTVASLYESLGADFLAVSNVEEALELRLGGVTLPILILGYTSPESARALAEHRISQCVFSLDYARALSREAEAAGVMVDIHIKIDSGMGRIGFPVRSCETFSRAIDEIAVAASLPRLRREGIFTHFAKSDMGERGRAFTEGQLADFRKTLRALEARGITFPIVHAANSAAICDYPDATFDMVRAGIVLYGYPPSDGLNTSLPVRPALSLKSILDMVKPLAVGESLSYGGDFVAERETLVATVPIGYADGLWRSMAANGLYPTLRGHAARVIGRLCMDQCMLDVSEIPDAALGDVVTVFGGDAEDASSLAARNGSIAYELICALGERLPRVYYRSGEIVAIKDRILPEE